MTAEAKSEDMVLVKFPDGQRNHFPASVAGDNKKLKEFVRGMGFSELAEANIERTKDAKGNTVVTFVKQAGKKGGGKSRRRVKSAPTPLAGLVKAKPFNNRAASVAARIESGSRVPSSILFDACARAVDEFTSTNNAVKRLRAATPAAGTHAEVEI